MLRGCATPGREMAEPGVLCGKDKTKMGLLKGLVVSPNRALRQVGLGRGSEPPSSWDQWDQAGQSRCCCMERGELK